MERVVWSTSRKLQANLLPMLCAVPFVVAAVVASSRGLEWVACALLAMALLVAAISLNWLGLVGNRTMRKELAVRLHPNPTALFVGFAEKGYFSWLDPHQELGFLELENNELKLRGEILSVRLARNPSVRCRFAFNPHSLLGLGRFIEVTSDEEGGGTVLLEPRECDSLRANRALGAELIGRIREWADPVTPDRPKQKEIRTGD